MNELITKCRAIMVFLLLGYLVAAADSAGVTEESVKWNGEAQSQILNVKGLAGASAWQVRSMLWPSDAETSTASVPCDVAVKAEGARWIRKFVRREYVPAGLESHMIAMKGWGRLFDKESEKLADVFVVRFRTGSSVVHIQESPYNVVVSIADDESGGRPKTAAERKALVLETAARILDPNLITDCGISFHEAGLDTATGANAASRFLWVPPSVVMIDGEGRIRLDIDVAARMGAFEIDADTDGRFVRFDVLKSVEGPQTVRDPYKQRFEPNKASSPVEGSQK